MTAPVEFFQRRFPSANAVLLRGPRPVLVDPGFGADVPALVAWLHAVGTPPEALDMVVNSHFDCDHAGANHALAETYGLPIATGAMEAAMVNARDPASCRAHWLRQPVEPYRVATALREGDIIDTGAAQWRVLDTPGHTPGHISLYAADAGLLVTGDVVHAGDLGWIDPLSPGAAAAADATIARLAALPVQAAYSGHGPPTLDPAAAFARARQRLARWRDAPEGMAWHGLKRVFAYALIIEDGLPEAAIAPYLLACPWFCDYADSCFGTPPAAFVDRATGEMLRSGAAGWVAGRLVATVPYAPPPPGWATAPVDPVLWPR